MNPSETDGKFCVRIYDKQNRLIQASLIGRVEAGKTYVLEIRHKIPTPSGLMDELGG